MLHHLSHHRSPVSREQYNSNFTRSLPCVPDFSKLAKFFPNVPKTLHRNFLFPLKLTLLVDGAAAGGFLCLVCRHRYTPSMPLVCCCCCSVSNKDLCPTLCGLQHANLPCSYISRSLLKLMSIESVMPSNHLILCYPPFPPALDLSSFRVFSNELALPIKRPNIGASASASALPMNIQGWFPLGLTGLISCSPRDSQESFLASQFESINSSMLSLLDLGFYKQNPCFCCQGQESVITGVLWTGGIHPLLCFLGSVVTLPCTEQHPLPVWAARLMTWVTSALIHPSVSSST